MTETSFPVIDISYAIESKGNFEADDGKIKNLCAEIMQAFGEWGFIYFKGHGIENDLIKKMFEISKDFFTLPQDKKDKLTVDTNNSENINGYVPFRMESFDSNKPHDLKEAFDYMTGISDEMKSNAPASFLSVLDEMYKKCNKLAMLILTIINLALNIEDKQFLVNAHKRIGKPGNISVLRSLYYPAVARQKIEELQSRCGEHTDYGTVTLLFQDNTGGLGVQSPTGQFIPAVPIEDTIVVNAADMLERWTSGKIKSTFHRVVLPTDRVQARQSFVFFCQPDNDFVVECLDGSNKYEPISSFDYKTSRLKSTFN